MKLAWSSLTATAVTAFLALVVPTCNGSGGSAGNAAGTCEHYINFLTRCASDGYDPTSLAHMKDRYRAVCTQDLALPGTGLQADQISACVAAMDTMSCDDHLPDSCDTPPGTFADGAACASSSQCKSTECEKPGSSDCGTCAPRAQVGETCGTRSCANNLSCSNGKCVALVDGDIGAACGTGGASCKSNLRCDYLTDKCAARSASGGACLNTSDCQSGLVCPQDKCVAPLAQGAPCNPAQSECDKGFVCDPASKTCKKHLHAKPGDACDGVVTGCAMGSCSATGGAGKCPTIIADNQPCDTNDRTQTCDFMAWCDLGTCNSPFPAVCN